MSIDQTWNDDQMGKTTETPKKNLLQCHLIHHEPVRNLQAVSIQHSSSLQSLG